MKTHRSKLALLLAFTLCLLLTSPGAFAAILVVTNSASLGPGTLRQALSDNIALGGGNTIVFSNVTGTITLQGELSVLAPVTILGPGTNILAINGNNSVRVFTVTAGPTLISDLTIRNGRAGGANGQGGQQDGQDGLGGGIYNLNSVLTLSNCMVLSNSVVGGVGADRQNGIVGKGGKGLGGGICNSGGNLSLVATVFGGNQSTGGRGGFAMNNAAGPGDDGYGGAIYSSTGTGQISRCTFIYNQVTGGQGGGSGSGGQPGAGGQGYGGAVYSVSPLTIASSTLSGNSANGGAAGNGIGSGSSQGGGIYSISSLSLYSCTIVSNTALSFSTDFGGGILAGSDTGMTNCTIAFNQSDTGGGIHGTAALANSMVAGNTASTGPDFNGTINSQDYNLIQNTNGTTFLGTTTHVITGQDPLLGSLQDNGGPTFTMTLLAGSPALDQGKSFTFVTDQRGSARPSNFPSIADAAGGDGSDIGAFELFAIPREFGVDVSHFQGETGVSQSSWNLMFAAGKRFAFIKATEGLSVLDAAMENNANRATAAGLRAGVYHFAHPELRPTTNGAIQEADYLLTYAGNLIGPGYLRPVIDLEFSAAAPSTTELTDWVIAFANEIVVHRGAGAAPIIYCNQSFANNEFDARLANYDLWLRTITGLDPALNDPPVTSFPDPTGVFDNWSFWQYSDIGSSGGISPLDLNICHSEFKPLDSFLIPAMTNPVAPGIVEQPVSRTVIVSNNVSFSVTVTVDTATPFAYQWRFNGTNLAGATARTFTRTSTQFADAGEYTVVISNVANSLTSSVATLTVVPPPPPVQGVTLWSENFDGYASPSIVTTNVPTNGFKIFYSASTGLLDFKASFGFDYSTVGSPTTVPSAPHSTGGTTKGLTLTVNKDATAAITAVNLYPMSQVFTGSYALKFDLWINHANNGTATEHTLFGINHSANVTNRVGLAASDGLFFAVDGDGGASSGSTALRDFSVFAGGGTNLPILLSTNSFFGPEPLLGPQFDNADSGFGALFPAKVLPGATTASGSAGLGWVSVEVRQLTNQITWLLNNVIVAQYTNVFPFTNGNILIGYQDNFPSAGSNANFAILDNLRVETAIPDYDYDGLTDQWELQFFGNLAANPTADADGDGASNLNEFLAGTNPTNAASAFRLLSATIAGNDVVLNWTAVGARSYVVQSQTPVSGITGNFTDLSPVIAIGGTNETTTNYVHIGGATNSGVYYRVRLSP